MRLFGLRQFMAGTWDFERVAREDGTAVLCALCGNDISEATIDTLIDGVLDILRKVVRSQSN